jgi:hypothetical protein
MMMRKQLLGIRDRAERTASSAREPLPAERLAGSVT